MPIATLLNRDMRFFNAAKSAALESDFKIKVGAIAVYGGKIVASCYSQNKTHPLQRKYNQYRDFKQEGLVFDKLHAEIGLLAQIKKLDIDMRNVSVYVYRICRCREHGMARPCSGCMKALLDAGIVHVYYSTDIGFAYERIGIAS